MLASTSLVKRAQLSTAASAEQRSGSTREKQSLLSSQLLSEQLLSVLKSGESRGVWLPHRFL